MPIIPSLMRRIAIRIRLTVLFFSTVLALVLYQTGDSSNGTWAALLSMALTVLALYVINRPKKLCWNFDRTLLLICLLYLFVSQVLLGSDLRHLYKILSQILFTWILFDITITDAEGIYLKKAFQVAMCVYAIMIIQSVMSNPLLRVHSSILLFETLFDPNFVGLPIVLASILLLDDFLNSFSVKNYLSLILSVLGYIVCLIAIVQTASRGNMLGLTFGSVLLIIKRIRKKKSPVKSLFIILFLSLFSLFAIRELFFFFEDSMMRMTDFGEGADNNRFYLWAVSFEQFLNHPIFGGGLGSVAHLYGHESHNTYLQLLSETGLVGFILYVTLFARLYKKSIMSDPTMSIVLLTMFLLSFFLNCLENRSFWALLAWIVMLPKTKTVYKYI